jgi:hypothetical protein
VEVLELALHPARQGLEVNRRRTCLEPRERLFQAADVRLTGFQRGLEDRQIVSALLDGAD